MKKYLMIGCLLLAVTASSQESSTTWLGGPVFNGEAWSLQWGVAKKLTPMIYTVAMAEFGEQIEASGQLIVMVAKYKGLTFGPMIGAGADWSDEPGPEGEQIATYFTKAAGVVGTFAISKSIGLWGYAKHQSPVTASEIYKDGYIGGIGIWLRL